MTWREYVTRNTCSAAEAVQSVKSGDRVVFGHAAGSPECLIEALVARSGNLRRVEIVHMVALNDCAYCKPEHGDSFHFNGLYMSGGTRQAVKEGRADYTPVFFSQIPELFRNGAMPVDVAMLTVSPPDAEGRVSLGVAVDYTLEAALRAKTTIAVINPNMPRIGGALLDVREIGRFVMSREPLLQLAPPAIGPIEKAIGANISALIQDGDCLQLGIGAIPDAVLSVLGGKKDIGIHSEMISDGVMQLVEQGVVNGARKTLHRGKIIITFAMGTEKFYKWLDGNPDIEGYPVDYVNDPRVIGQNDNLVSINSALSIDLLGQAAADAIGPQQYSGVGGQVDFVRGARFSKGGRSIIALPATAAKGSISRICDVFSPGQAVTTSRNDIDHVVTEYGVAALRGKTCAERAQALIAIAAPEFRDNLLKQARDIYGWRIG